MSGIFLAHSSKDKRFVRQLAADFVYSGIQVWFDEAEIKVGDSFLQKIEQGIQSMEYLGVILSPNSVNSHWVQKEVESALVEEIEGKRIKVLPILYKSCDIPAFLRAKQWADFRDRKSYSKNFNMLLERLASSNKELPIFKIWTPKAVRLGLLCGLLMTKSGTVVFSENFLEELKKVGRLWINDELALDSRGAAIVYAACMVIKKEKDSTIPITLDDSTFLFNEMSMQVLKLMITVGVKCGIMLHNREVVWLDGSFMDEIREQVVTYGIEKIQTVQDVARFIKKAFAQTVRAYLLVADEDGAYSNYLAMFCFSLYENSDEYKKLLRIAEKL